MLVIIGGVFFILWNSYMFSLCEGAPQLCHEDRHFHNITREEGRTGNLSVCIVSHCKTSGCLQVHVYQQINQIAGAFNGDRRPNGIAETSRFRHTWTQNETMQHLHWLHLEIYNITQNDYGVWNVVISASGHKNLSFSIHVLNPSDVNNISFKFRSVRASNELTLTLSCTAGGRPTSVEIRRQGETRSLARKGHNLKNYLHELTAHHDITPALCSHMTTYECVVENHYFKHKTVQTLDVPVEKCPARICKHQQQSFKVYAQESGSAYITMCVLAYPRISNTFFIDNASYNIVDESTWIQVDRKNSTIYNYIRVRIDRLGADDFRNYSVRIMSLLDDSVNFTVELVKTVKNITSDVGTHPPPLCTNRSTVCVLLHSKTHLLLYLEKDFYRQNRVLDWIINASKHQDAVMRFQEPATLDLEFWTMGTFGEITTQQLNPNQGDNWVYLGQASGLTFCYDHGLQVHWKQRHPGRDQDIHTPYLTVTLNKISQSSTRCLKTEFHLTNKDEPARTIYALSVEESFNRYNATKDHGLVRPAKLSLYFIISTACAICLIFAIITTAICVWKRKRRKATVKESPRESTYLTVTDSTYETIKDDTCITSVCFRF